MPLGLVKYTGRADAPMRGQVNERDDDGCTIAGVTIINNLSAAATGDLHARPTFSPVVTHSRSSGDYILTLILVRE